MVVAVVVVAVVAESGGPRSSPGGGGRRLAAVWREKTVRVRCTPRPHPTYPLLTHVPPSLLHGIL